MNALIERNRENVTSAVKSLTLVDFIVNTRDCAIFVEFNTENCVLKVRCFSFNGSKGSFALLEIKYLATERLKHVGKENEFSVDICAGE